MGETRHDSINNHCADSFNTEELLVRRSRGCRHLTVRAVRLPSTRVCTCRNDQLKGEHCIGFTTTAGLQLLDSDVSRWNRLVCARASPKARARVSLLVSNKNPTTVPTNEKPFSALGEKEILETYNTYTRTALFALRFYLLAAAYLSGRICPVV